VSADVTLGGATVVAGNLLLPRVGAATCWISSLDAETAPTGAASLIWLGTTLQGVITHSGISEGRVSVCWTAGKGGLWKELPAKGYDAVVPASLILGHIMAESGETLSPSSTGLFATVPTWARKAGTAATALDLLADALGAVWRVLPDGSIWWGAETWPASSADGELLSADVALGLFRWAPLTLSILPGQTFQGGRVGCCSYTAAPGSQRCRVWLLGEARQENPLRSGLVAVVREELRACDYLAMYPCQVVAQHTNGTVDVIPDSERMPPLSSVPLRGPAPGAKVTLPSAGARALLGFLEGTPSKHYAMAWEQGTGGAAVARVGDTVVAAAAMVTWMSQVAGAINGLAPGSVSPATPSAFGTISTGSPHLALLPGTST